MKLEIGGGGPAKKRGGDWINLDQCETADIRHDLTAYPWPLADGSVSAVYSSHCLEHLPDPMRVMHEICRVCQVGSEVEIRVPHPQSDLAMIWTHLHVWSPVAALNVDVYFPDEHWTGPKRLKLQRMAYEPSIFLAEARGELPFLRDVSDEAIMKWFGRAAHEVRYFYVVTANDHSA